MFYWLLGIAGLVVLLIALFPRGEPRVGLVAGKLGPCPNTPNCVCSEGPHTPATIAPLKINDSADSAWQAAKQAALAAGGQIQAEQDGYLWLSFTTRWLRFVDDVELRLDAESGVIHVRSASRLGRSDFGVNRKRVEEIRHLFAGAAVER